VRWKRYRARHRRHHVKKPEASFFLQRGFGENIDFGPFLQFFADDTTNNATTNKEQWKSFFST
jgi:hypothetical protein